MKISNSVLDIERLKRSFQLAENQRKVREDYNKSLPGRAAAKKYEQSAKGKAARKRYTQTAKYKVSRKRLQHKYYVYQRRDKNDNSSIDVKAFEGI